ncbi:MAG: hypothetical protein AAGK04_05150 [Planctomycetota bacterium]
MHLFPTLAGIENNLIPLVAIVGGLFIGLIVIIAVFTTEAAKTKRKQETARELAAYVAEGSMTTDEAERILRAADIKDD